MKTAIIVILTVAVLGLAIVCYLREKQVKSLTARIQNLEGQLNSLAIKHDKHLRRTVRLCCKKPQKITAQYLSMKMSNLLEDFFVVDGDNFYLDVLTPEKPVNDSDK